MRGLLLSVQKFLVTHEHVLQLIALILEVGSVILIGLSVIIFALPNPPSALLREWGSRCGYFGLILYWLTLLPGILQRFRAWPLIAAILVHFRRTLGVLMFLLVILHVLLTTALPVLFLSRPLTINGPKIFGTLAVLLLIPLWLTSNDYFQQKLGHNWKKIQRLTYLILLVIFLHISYFRPLWTIPTFVVMVLELGSWLMVWYRRKHAPPAPVVAPVETPTPQLPPLPPAADVKIPE